MSQESWPSALPRSARRWALVVIDVQNDFCHPTGLHGALDHVSASTDAAIDRIQQTASLARDRQIPVVWVRTEHSDRIDSPAWDVRHDPPRGTRSCLAGSWGAEFYRVAPEPTDVVVTKNRYSAFAGTELTAVLAHHGRDAVAFCGFATDVCVESSVRDATCLDYYVAVVSDCSDADSAEVHRAALARIEQDFGRVLTAHQLIGALETP